MQYSVAKSQCELHCARCTDIQFGLCLWLSCESHVTACTPHCSEHKDTNTLGCHSQPLVVEG
jgi:hypothetical protein